jgi:opacity protein-like surface antigen
MTKPGKFILLFSTILVLTALTTSAAAQDNYFSWKIGTSQMTVDSISGLGTYSGDTMTKPSEDDDATAFSIAYGNKLNDGPLSLRMEIELTFRSALDYSADPLNVGGIAGFDDISSDINSHTLFANLYLDLFPKAKLSPYVGGGVGLSWNVWDYGAWWDDDSETTTGLAWNVGAGIAVKLNRKLTLDVSYRYVDFGEAEIAGKLKIDDITTNEVMLGLRLNF